VTVESLLADARAATDRSRVRALLAWAVERAPTHATARYRYGRHLLETADDPEAAAEQFAAALAADPDHPGARNALAVRALRAGDEAAARERLAGLVADEPADPVPERAPAYARARTNYAHLLRETDPEGARRSFERAAALDPDDPHAPHDLGLLLADAFDDPEGARGAFETALARDPTFAPALVDLGNLLWRSFDDPEGARDRYDRAVAAAPDAAFARYSRGTLRLDAFDDPEGAREAYEAALARDPDHADAHRKLGETLWRLGDPEGARERYERALALDPADEAARLALVALPGA
jgi:tetratricopeptide (TPR) repeat protein